MFMQSMAMVLMTMDNMSEVRRRNLYRLVGQYDSQADMARALGMTPQGLSSLLTGARPFGERAARSIERTLHVALGWLDRNGGSESGPGIAGLDDESIQLARRIQELTPRDRAAVVKLVESLRTSA